MCGYRMNNRCGKSNRRTVFNFWQAFVNTFAQMPESITSPTSHILRLGKLVSLTLAGGQSRREAAQIKIRNEGNETSVCYFTFHVTSKISKNKKLWRDNGDYFLKKHEIKNLYKWYLVYNSLYHAQKHYALSPPSLSLVFSLCLWS